GADRSPVPNRGGRGVAHRHPEPGPAHRRHYRAGRRPGFCRDPPAREAKPMILETKGISYSVRATPIVRDVTMQISEGETFGLVGPNGSGKSTLLRLIQGILAPSVGSSFLLGEDVTSLSRRRVAQTIA